MCRFYALEAVGGCKYLCVELLGRRIDDFPDFGQHGMVQAVFDLVCQDYTVRRGGYGQNQAGDSDHAFAHERQRHQF